MSIVKLESNIRGLRIVLSRLPPGREAADRGEAELSTMEYDAGRAGRHLSRARRSVNVILAAYPASPNFDDLNFDDEAGFEGPNS